MSRRKRSVSILLMFLLLFNTCMQNCVFANAAENPRIYGETVTVVAGGTVSIPIYVNGNPGISGMGVVLTYDEQIFTPSLVETGSVLSGVTVNDSIGSATDNTVLIMWANSENVTEDGVLFYVKFDVSAYARGEQTIGLSYSQADTFNAEDLDVVLECTDITVHVEKPQIESAYLSSYDDLAVVAGQNIEVPILLSNNKDLSAVEFDLSFDENIFEIAGITEETGITVTNIGNHFIVTGIEVLGEMQKLFTLKLATTGYGEGNYKFAFTSDSVNQVNFTVNVSNAENTENAVVYAGQISNDNEVITVPVMIRNNPGIAGFKMKVNYNSSVLIPVSVNKGSTIEGTLTDNIGVKTGSVTVLWIGTDNIYGTKELYTIRFKVADGVDTVNEQIVIEYGASDIVDESGKSVSLDAESISLTWTRTQNPVDPPEDGDSSEDGSSKEDQDSDKDSTVDEDQDSDKDSTVDEDKDSGEDSTADEDKDSDKDTVVEPEIVYPSVGTVEVLSTGKFKITASGPTKRSVIYLQPKNKNAASVTIPSEVKIGGFTYKVTEIAANAFKNNKKLKQIKIGANVTKIGDQAFYQCTNLKKVTGGTSLVTIGKKAFYKCVKLAAFTFNKKVNKIGASAFEKCKKLKKLTFKTTKLTAKKISSKAFKGIYSKVAVKVPAKKLKLYKKILKSKGVSAKAKIKK